MDTVAQLGDLLVRLRNAAGLGPAELARRAGLSERTLRDLERGVTGRPRLHSVRALASALDRREPERSRRELCSALVHARRAGDVRLVGRVLNNLGTLSMELGRLGDAERLLLAALEAKRRGDAGDVDCGRTLFNLAETAVDDGRYEVGLLYAEMAVRRLVRGGHRRLAAFAATTAALAHLHRGEVGAAVAACGKATALLETEEHDDRRTPAVIELRCSVAFHACGERARAVELLRQAIPAGLASPKRDREEVADVLEMHADLMSGRDAVAAARMLGTAARVRRGSTRPITPACDSVARRAAVACRERLGDNTFDRHHRRGFTLDRQGLLEMYAVVYG